MARRTPVQGVPLPPSGTRYRSESETTHNDEYTPTPALLPTPLPIETRVLLLERDYVQVQKRLSQGADTFTRMDMNLRELKDATAPKPKSILPYIGLMVSIIVFLATTIWQAAKYPDRGEFEKLKVRQEESNASLKEDVNRIQIDQVQVKSAVQSIQEGQRRAEEQVKDINQKLDRALRPGR